MKIKIFLRRAALILLFSVLETDCMFLRVRMNTKSGWRGFDPHENSKIAIGYFEVVSPRSPELKKKILSDAVHFNLERNGLDVLDNGEWNGLLRKESLPENRMLEEFEIFKMSERFPGQYILQGNLYEFLSDDGLEEKISISLDCHVSDALSGNRIATVKIHKSNLKRFSGKEIFYFAKKLTSVLTK